MKQYKLVRLQAMDFRSLALVDLKEAELAGLTYIGGANLDTPHASSNMAGKTSLACILTHTLYGCDLVGDAITTSSIKYDTPRMDTGVTLVCGKEEVYVQRTRKRTGSPAVELYVRIIDPSVRPQLAKTYQGPPADVQPIINQMFGEQDIFLAAHVFGYSERSLPFASQTDGARRALFEHLIDVADLERAYQRANDACKAVDDKLRRIELATTRVQGKLQALKEVSDSTVQKKAVQEALRTKQSARITLSQACAKAQQEERAFAQQEEKHNKAMLALEARLAKVNLQETIRRSQRDAVLERCEHTGSMLRGKHTACPLCQSSLSSHQLEHIRGEIGKSAQQAQREYLQGFKTFDQQSTKLRDRTAVTHALLKGVVKRKAQAAAEVAQHVHRIADINLEIAQLEQELVVMASHQRKTQESMQTYKQHLRKYAAAQTALEAKREHLVFWRDAFGAKGVYSYRLSQLTPEMNAIAAAYSGMLYGDGQHVEYCTQRLNTNGTAREAFECVLVDANSDIIQVRSGGQNTRRDIVHTLTMLEVAKRYGKRTVDIAIFDEVFRTVDTEGISAVISVLEQLGQDIGGIWVIEHNDDLAARFGKRWIVQRTNGTSSVHTQQTS